MMARVVTVMLVMADGLRLTWRRVVKCLRDVGHVSG